jgi:hypothetical protein
MKKRKGKGGKRGGHKFLQEARARMEEKGTVGAFGKATPGKISRAKKKGGAMKKRAVFAENMRKIARKHKRGRKRASKR